LTAYPHLFSPGDIAGLAVQNRIVQPPMGTGLVEEGRVSERDVAFQEERARNGVGLIITGAAVVHPTSMFPVRIIVEAWDEEGIPALRERVEAVQRHGTRIFGQLVHLGRESPGGLTNSVPMAPSPIPSPRDPSAPHEMSAAEVRMIVEAFGVSAANFQAAGYDGVEISAGHGYLVAQFLSQVSNRRTDAYRGDTLEGRTRLLCELVEEIRGRCGAGYPLGIRLSGDEETPDGLTVDKKPQPNTPALRESTSDNSVILVADVDMLADGAAVDVQEMFGRKIVVPSNGNLAFALGMVEQFAAGNELISLRSRATAFRPLTVVRELEAQAQQQYLGKIQALEDELQKTNAKLQELQKAQGGAAKGGQILTAEQQAELERFRKRVAETRLELKEVRRSLRQDAEALVFWTKVVNIALMPILVALAGLAIALARRRRMAR